VSRTLILGLGNPILTDDGVGVRVAEEIRTQLPEDTEIDISEASVGGLTLMELMIGYNHVVLIDSIISQEGIPGSFRRMSVDELRSISPTQHSASPHDASLVTALEAGRRLGLPLPEEISIYAINVQNVDEFNDQPTPPVAAAIPLVTQAVLEEIQKG
jgi:hydrogenase maturation protease